jgi:hypothetical protein
MLDEQPRAIAPTLPHKHPYPADGQIRIKTGFQVEHMARCRARGARDQNEHRGGQPGLDHRYFVKIPMVKSRFGRLVFPRLGAWESRVHAD